MPCLPKQQMSRIRWGSRWIFQIWQPKSQVCVPSREGGQCCCRDKEFSQTWIMIRNNIFHLPVILQVVFRSISERSVGGKIKCFSQFDLRNIHVNQDPLPHVCPPQLFAKWELLVTTAQACPRHGWSCAPIWAPPGSVLAPCAAQQPQPLLTPVPVLLEPGAGSHQCQVSLASCTQTPTQTHCAAEGTTVSSSHPRGPQARAASDGRLWQGRHPAALGQCHGTPC